MALSVCPTANVAAPIERVWALLGDAHAFDAWWDARTIDITPPGPAQPGQVIRACSRALGRDWPLTIAIEAVDAARHTLDLTTKLPFGLAMHNHFVCHPLAEGATRVSFG